MIRGNLLYQSAQIITTSAEVTPKGSLVGESSENSLKSGLGIIVVIGPGINQPTSPRLLRQPVKWWGSRKKRIGSPPTRERVPFSAGLQKNCFMQFHRVETLILFLPTIVEPTTGYNPPKTSFLLNHDFIQYYFSLPSLWEERYSMLKVEKAGLFPEKMELRKDRHSSLVFWFFCIDSYQYWLMSYLYVSHISHPSKYTYGHLSTVLIQHVQVQVWKKKNLYIICFMFSPSTVSSLWINKNINSPPKFERIDEGGNVSPAVFLLAARRSGGNWRERFGI